MKKFERINTIMRYIQNRGQFTIREISETFNISRSTAIRDIQEIEGMGFPLVAEVGRDGGYFVVTNELTSQIQFTEDEIKALFLAFQASKNQQFPYLKGRQSLTEKLIAMISDVQKDQLIQLSEAIVFESTNPLNTNLLELSDQANPELESLLAAYLDGQQVKVHYGQEEPVVLRIHRFYHTHDGWTVEAFDVNHDKFHLIDLANIQSVGIIESVDLLSDADIAKKMNTSKLPANVVLALKPDSIKQFKKYHPVNFTIRYLDPFQMTAIVKGVISPDIRESEVGDLVSWILFLGKNIEIKRAPSWLSKKMADRLTARKK